MNSGPRIDALEQRIVHLELVTALAHRQVLQELKHIVSGWTPVDQDNLEKNPLPPPHEHFLALNRDGRIFESCMCYGMHQPFFTCPYGDGSASNTAPDWIDVTHWMPKPELPQ